MKSCSDTKTCVEVKHEGSLLQGNHPAHDHFKNNQEIQFLKKECTCSGVTAGCCVLPLPALKAHTSSCLLLQLFCFGVFLVFFATICCCLAFNKFVMMVATLALVSGSLRMHVRLQKKPLSEYFNLTNWSWNQGQFTEFCAVVCANSFVQKNINRKLL